MRSWSLLVALAFLGGTVHEAQASIVGVKFGLEDSVTAPANWTIIHEGTPLPAMNLINETGAPTGIDLSLQAAFGDPAFFDVVPGPATIPSHTNLLGTFIGNAYVFGDTTNGNASLTAVFSNLAPNALYDIWVFAARGIEDIAQTVTITGAGAPIGFNQGGAKDSLWVNGSVGSNADPLEDYAQLVTSSSTGTISINIASFGDTHPIDTAVLSGLALRPVAPDGVVPEAASLVVWSGLSLLGAATIGMRQRRAGV